MRQSLIILFNLLLILHSCSSKSSEDGQQDVQIQLSEREFYDFDTRNHLDQPEELLLSSVANEIRYIPLETTPACFLSGCRQVRIFGGHIYVKDRKALYRFDMDGSFVQQIGKIGNGPGEYGSALWFNFIASSNEIALYSYPSGRVNIHDAVSGEFKRSFRPDFDSNGFAELQPGKLAFLTWNSKQAKDPGNSSEIYICTLNGDIMDSIPDGRLPRSGNVVSPNHYYVYDESLHYMEFFQDTMYTLSKDAKKEAYIAFGLENKVQRNELEIKRLIGEIQYPDFLHIGNVLENESSFYFTVEMGLRLNAENEELKFFYDKSSGQTVNCTSVINDLDNGMPFWPKSVYKDSVLIDFYPAIEFLEYFQTNFSDSERSDDLNDLINRVNVNDNPIVILACQPMIKEPEL